MEAIRITASRLGHTRLDWEALVAVDPTLPGRTQPREHQIRCMSCGTLTMNQAGRCDAHWAPPSAALVYAEVVEVVEVDRVEVSA